MKNHISLLKFFTSAEQGKASVMFLCLKALDFNLPWCSLSYWHRHAYLSHNISTAMQINNLPLEQGWQVLLVLRGYPGSVCTQNWSTNDHARSPKHFSSCINLFAWNTVPKVIRQAIYSDMNPCVPVHSLLYTKRITNLFAVGIRAPKPAVEPAPEYLQVLLQLCNTRLKGKRLLWMYNRTGFMLREMLIGS